jgi:acyl carrier protein
MRYLAEAKAIVAEATKIPPDALPEDANIETFPAWDSIAHIGVILGLEEKFGRQLAPEMIVSVTSLESIAALLAGEADDG